jgi:subtilisin family serine protease
MAEKKTPELSLETLHETPYGWPLRQLRIPQAHKITRGRRQVVVAVIDIGYRFHPDHKGHLWRNPDPKRGDLHGWDCHDDDASLEYTLHDPDSPYHRNHHAFVVGEVISCAPLCKVMVVRVGYGNPESWWKGVDYAVEHGAKILVMPHGFISHGTSSPIPLFYRGTDFGYPIDNPRLRRSLEAAYEAGCLTVKGTADNRGRRVASAVVACDCVMAFGSSNPEGEPADICASADYVEAAAPAGQRNSRNEQDFVWSTGGDDNYVSFTGGCMASGFAGGVAALVMSRFPKLTNVQVRQVLRNTAASDTWDPWLGWGVLDAGRAVSLKPEQLGQRLKVRAKDAALQRKGGKFHLRVPVENRGAFDVKRALVAAFSGNPLTAAAPRGTMEKPIILKTIQIGHAIASVRGLHETLFDIALVKSPENSPYVQACTLDQGGSDEVHTVRVPL